MGMRLGVSDANQVLVTTAEIHRVKSTAELAEVRRNALHRLVPADIHEIAIVGRGSEHFYLPTPGGYDGDEQKAAFEYVNEHPTFQVFMRQGDPGPMRISDVLPLREWRNSRYYAVTHQRLRQDYEITTSLPAASPHGVGAIAISRSSRDFSSRDRAVLWHLREHIGLALARVREEERRQAMNGSMQSLILALEEMFPELTPRELETYYWIIEGKRDSEIALILGLSPLTVATHVKNLLGKLGMESRLAAAVHALRSASVR